MLSAAWDEAGGHSQDASCLLIRAGWVR